MKINALVAEAMPVMTAEVLRQAKNVRLTSPLARLKFWYYDTCAPSCYLLGHALTLHDRDHIVATAGINAGSKLWNGEGPIEISVGLADKSPSRAILAIAYKWMSMEREELAQEGLTDAAREMSRILAQSLSQHLNAFDWTDVCPVTDDFVVYAQNGTDYGCDCYDDLVASVPEEKLTILRSRGLMGMGERFAFVPAAEK